MKVMRCEDVAILFISHLARCKQEYVPLSSIAKNHGLSVLYLKKIALELRHAGLIVSKEGQGGGYRLKRQPDELTLYDIVRCVDSGAESDKGAVVCPINSRCLPQQIRRKLFTSWVQGLRSVRISEFI